MKSVGGVFECGGKLDSNSVPQALVIFKTACVYYGLYFNIGPLSHTFCLMNQNLQEDASVIQNSIS